MEITQIQRTFPTFRTFYNFYNFCDFYGFWFTLNFDSKSMGNFSSSIQCWDSNSWPSERESPPKTTRMMAKTSICDPKFPRNFILRKSVDTSLSTLRTCHLNVEQQVVSRFWLKLKEWMRQSQLTTFSQIVI